MKVTCIGTGSSGNCFYVESELGTGVYFDAGCPPEKILDLGISIANKPFHVTHEHGDHAKYALELQDKYGAIIHCSDLTFEALNLCKKYSARRLRDFYPKKSLSVHGIKVIHNAADPYAFYAEIDGECVLYVADSGQPPELPEGLTPDALIVEANYTPKRMAENAEKSDSMLYVSGRVSSGVGHLSAREAAELVEPYLNYADLIILFHQSESNFDYTEYQNDPQISSAFKTKAQFAKPGMTWNSIPF